jgi:hypothetical protein
VFNVYYLWNREIHMDDDLESDKPTKVKKPLKGLQRLYEEPMEDEDLINTFKHDHGIQDHYDE